LDAALFTSPFFRRLFLPYLLLICTAVAAVGLFAGIRLRYRHHNLNGRYPFVFLRYRKPGQTEFPKEQYQKYSPTGDHGNWLRSSYARQGDDFSTMDTWIYDRIDLIELMPDGQPCEFELLELTLLVPQDKTSTSRP